MDPANPNSPTPPEQPGRPTRTATSASDGSEHPVSPPPPSPAGEPVVDPRQVHPQPASTTFAPPPRRGRFGRILAMGLLAVAVLLLAGIYLLATRLDGIVKSTVEREGTAQLDLATTLDGAHVSIFGRSANLDGLRIANPEGYTDPHLFELGQINVGVSYRQLLGDPVRVGSIDISSPTLYVERSGEGLRDLARINLRDLLERLDPAADEEPTHLIIDRLTVSNAVVVIRPNLRGLDPEYRVVIPDVVMEDIGTADEAQTGAEIGRIASDLAMTLARRAAESEQLPEELRGLLAGDLRQIASQYGEKLRAEVTDEIERRLGELEDRLGGEAAGFLERLRGGAGQDQAGDIRDRAEGEVERGRERVEDEVRRGLDRLRPRPRQDDPPPPQ